MKKGQRKGKGGFEGVREGLGEPGLLGEGEGGAVVATLERWHK